MVITGHCCTAATAVTALLHCYCSDWAADALEAQPCSRLSTMSFQSVALLLVLVCVELDDLGMLVLAK